ncbi:MAG: hypothetical protein EP343_30410 [Deltaproteobacteria bacterium]|nr:MAG: hypothetical protein EP343_30410 [Deltaproteobacteria bacterium]
MTETPVASSSTSTLPDRFLDRGFLRKRGGQVLFGTMLQGILKSLVQIAMRLVVFGALCWLGWSAVSLELSKPREGFAFLLPVLVFSFPILALTSRRSWFSMIANIGFGLALVGTFFWLTTRSALTWKTFPWQWPVGLLLLVLLLVFLVWRLLKHNAVQSSLFVFFWLMALITNASALGYLVFRISRPGQLTVSSNALAITGALFVFFVLLAGLRVLWMDAARESRTKRIDKEPRSNAILLLEWLLPHTSLLLIIAPCLLFSEALLLHTMFEAIKVRPKIELMKEKQKQVLQWQEQFKNKASLTKLQQTNLNTQVDKTQLEIKALEQTIGHAKKMKLTNWMGVVIDPQGFPKIDGKEVEAPSWFLWLAGIIGALLIAAILRQQFVIWQGFSSAYQKLLALEIQEYSPFPNDAKELSSQRSEALEDFRAMLNGYGSFWCRIVLSFATAPTHSARSWILDPGHGVQSTFRLITEKGAQRGHWAMWGVSGLLGIVMFFSSPTPIRWVPILTSLWPSLLLGGVLLGWRVLRRSSTAQILPSWTWFLVPLHFGLSVAVFFLETNLSNPGEQWVVTVLQYSSVLSAFGFVLAYFVVGSRWQSATTLEVSSESHLDLRAETRRRILRLFAKLERREWTLEAFVYRIHPVRSGFVCMLMILPSFVLEIITTLSIWLRAFLRFSRRIRVLWPTLCWLAGLGLLSMTTLPQATGRATLFASLLFAWPSLWCLTLYLFFRRRRSLRRTFPDDNLQPPTSWTKRWILSLLLLPLAAWLLGAWSFVVGLAVSLLAVGSSLPLLFDWSVPPTFAKQDEAALSTNEEAEASESSEEETPAPVPTGWFYRLAQKWEELVNVGPDDDIYRLAFRFGGSDRTSRQLLLDSLQESLTQSQQALCNGNWFREEERELNRVYYEWLVAGGSMRTAPEELASFWILGLDLLGSMLVDLHHPTRRGILYETWSSNYELTRSPTSEQTWLATEALREDVWKALLTLLNAPRPALDVLSEDARATLFDVLRDLETFLVTSFQEFEDKKEDAPKPSWCDHRPDPQRVLQALFALGDYQDSLPLSEGSPKKQPGIRLLLEQLQKTSQSSTFGQLQPSGQSLRFLRTNASVATPPRTHLALEWAEESLQSATAERPLTEEQRQALDVMIECTFPTPLAEAWHHYEEALERFQKPNPNDSPQHSIWHIERLRQEGLRKKPLVPIQTITTYDAEREFWVHLKQVHQDTVEFLVALLKETEPLPDNSVATDSSLYHEQSMAYLEQVEVHAHTTKQPLQPAQQQLLATARAFLSPEWVERLHQWDIDPSCSVEELASSTERFFLFAYQNGLHTLVPVWQSPLPANYLESTSWYTGFLEDMPENLVLYGHLRGQTPDWFVAPAEENLEFDSFSVVPVTGERYLRWQSNPYPIALDNATYENFLNQLHALSFSSTLVLDLDGVELDKVRHLAQEFTLLPWQGAGVQLAEVVGQFQQIWGRLELLNNTRNKPEQRSTILAEEVSDFEEQLASLFSMLVERETTRELRQREVMEANLVPGASWNTQLNYRVQTEVG